MDIEVIIAVIEENQSYGRDAYDGLTSEEIGRYNRYRMFGLEGDAFPGNDEWCGLID